MSKAKLYQTVLSEQRVKGGTEIELEFRANGDTIPAILQLPEKTPAPAAVMLHGYSSRKEVMSERIGSPLLQQGIASLAIDLPMHGARRVPDAPPRARNALELIKYWRGAVRDARLAVRYLCARAEVDSDRIALVGYSLGSFVSLAVAPDERCVRAVLLAAGGDLPDDMPFAAMARAVIDPRKLVRRLEGRPLLMVHGRRDRTVTPAQARRLFEAAAEPKQMIWYDAGHILPVEAAREAATWLADQLA